jgi:membrane associated rhomboid family serine protease
MSYYSSGNSFQRTTSVVLNLIIINVLVWVAQLSLDDSFGITGKFALYPYKSPLFEPYQLVTHMFTHGGWAHIIFNMFALWSFGTWLERSWGPKKFLIFYLACGLVAGITHLVFENVPAVGASGAIMGLLAAFAYLFPNTEMIIFPIPVPIKAKFAIAIMAAIDLFGGVYPTGGNIAHFAHLGGLAMGFILVIFWNKNNRKTFY